jgi:hypothetical protein
LYYIFFLVPRLGNIDIHIVLADQVNQRHEKVKEHRIDERKEFCCDQIMDNKDKNNQESQNM